MRTSVFKEYYTIIFVKKICTKLLIYSTKVMKLSVKAGGVSGMFFEDA